MRRRTTAVTALLTAMLALAGCGESGGETAKTKPSPTPTVDKRETFLTAARSAGIQSWIDKPPSDEELAALPGQWCAGLEQGHSVNWLFGEGGLYPYGSDWGTPKDAAYELLVMGVRVYCPKHQGQVKKELREMGEY
ncbi:hypothetical protein [Streptomyces rubradiris]|uniref:DUF732 domain-containing protein n=1 Tax=Streptomyces rubradiris TaxID=285531 RepID=A0ABQ3R3L6_STRRR|nr:hypothetical protein [Streptomyces rubradiris]GHH30178.1 hypothetical protein GCM10018792_76320 [Streptomyces rubradiris]GHI50413.1 hypothetical protein Srubr_02590 [Streptomyces rubradiris]